MNSVEINGSFYSLQRPSSYQTWAGSVPADFVFAVKGSRFISHMKKLNDIEAPLANFWASGVLALDHQLGPILWQLPPNLGFDPDRMDAFCRCCRGPPARRPSWRPVTTNGCRRTGRLTATEHPDQPMRHAFEMRHETFRSAAFLRPAAPAPRWPGDGGQPGQLADLEELTTDFMYLRLHGHEQLYASGYSDPELDEWADRMRGWADRARTSSPTATTTPRSAPRTTPWV